MLISVVVYKVLLQFESLSTVSTDVGSLERVTTVELMFFVQLCSFKTLGADFAVVGRRVRVIMDNHMTSDSFRIKSKVVTLITMDSS